MYFWFKIFERSLFQMWMQIHGWPVSCCCVLCLWVTPYLLAHRAMINQMSLIKLVQSLWPIYGSLFQWFNLFARQLFLSNVLSGAWSIFFCFSLFLAYTQSMCKWTLHTNTHHNNHHHRPVKIIKCTSTAYDTHLIQLGTNKILLVAVIWKREQRNLQRYWNLHWTYKITNSHTWTQITK